MTQTIESFVRSPDGTTLRVVRAGDGAPIVLVHGTIGSSDDWAMVVPRMAESFSVTAFDRRGRSRSADADEYSIEREIEDVFAVIDAVGPPVHLVAHSFGAVVALLVAARASERLASLVVYEPPVGGSSRSGDGWLDDLEAAVACGDLDTAVECFLGAAGATTIEIAFSRRNERAWRAMRDAVLTVPREVRAAEAVLPIDSRLLESIAVPTLVLLGSEQRHQTYSGVAELADRIPRGRLAHVPGRHLAVILEPDAFVGEVSQFLAGVSPGAAR